MVAVVNWFVVDSFKVHKMGGILALISSPYFQKHHIPELPAANEKPIDCEKMGVQPPFLYDPVKQDSSRPYRDFDPRAVTRASLTPKAPKPKHEGPLISFNQHPEYDLRGKLGALAKSSAVLTLYCPTETFMRNR
jgi:hypothetical protein